MLLIGLVQNLIWLPSIKTGQGNSKLASQTAKKAIEQGINGNWIKDKVER